MWEAAPEARVAAILSTHQAMRGLLFDLPEVIAEAHAMLTKFGVAGHCRQEAGNVLEYQAILAAQHQTIALA
jgi:hypothetical protein